MSNGALPAFEWDVGNHGFLELAEAAELCPGYAMCHIDFLGTGVCPVAKKRRYAAFYPQGRLQVISAYRRGYLPLTRKLIEIALSCRFCGICDRQCYFIAGLRPMELFRAFAKHIAPLRRQAARVERDSFSKDVAAVVGEAWSSSDSAICASY